MATEMPRDDRGLERFAAEITQSDKKKGSPQKRKRSSLKKRKLSPIELLGKRLNISRSTIYQYAKQGKIPAFESAIVM